VLIIADAVLLMREFAAIVVKVLRSGNGISMYTLARHHIVCPAPAERLPISLRCPS